MLSLIARLDEYLSTLYPSEGIFGLDLESSKARETIFAVAYIGDTPVDCGAIGPLAEDIVELKRFYVDTTYRNRGIATKLLGFLENTAKSFHYKTILLETGNAQPEAIGLYTKQGYIEIVPFGEYIGCENSVCFRKELDKSEKKKLEV